jgi:replicative DNA helicase
MMIIAPTGVGKSRVLANMPFYYSNMNFALFDLELSEYQLGMRCVAYHNRLSFEGAEGRLEAGGYKLERPTIENLFAPKMSELTVAKIKAEVDRLEDIQERRIHVVAIDYISKMNRSGSLSESIINNCNDFKKYLVEENRIGIITTQSKRINDKVMKYNMPCKEDAIYTSAIEQNCQQAMCFCFMEGNHNIMLGRCDKYSHGSEPEHWVELDVSDMQIRYKGIHRRDNAEWGGE